MNARQQLSSRGPAAPPGAAAPRRPAHCGPFRAELRLQFRNGFYAAYLAMTLVFFFILVALPAGLREAGFTLIVLMDPAFMGFFFAGGLILLERDQGVLQYIVTRGQGFFAYWRAKVAAILSLAVIVVAALLVAASLLRFIEPDLRGVVFLSAGLLLTVPLFFSLGLVMAGRVSRVTDYFVYSGLALTPLMYPLVEPAGVRLGYLGIVSPVWGSVVLIGSMFNQRYDAAAIGAAVVALLLWNVAAYLPARRAFGRLAGIQTPRRAYPHAGRRLRFPRPEGSSACRRSIIPPDLRLLLRDPTNALILLAPLLAALAIGRGIPLLLTSEPAAALLPDALLQSLAAFMNNLRSFSLLLGVLMYGMLGGLLALDEKDAEVVPFLRTLPGRPGWFILRRSYLLLGLHLAMLPAVIVAGNLYHPQIGTVRFVLSLLVDALSLPIMFLALALLAANKVQGLALAKVLNVFTLPPLLLAALPARFAWLVGVFPTAWGSIMRLAAPGPAGLAPATALGSLYAATLLLVLYRKALVAAP